MRIGILGAGTMAATLGAQWARVGHEVMISGREPRRTAERAAEIGARQGAWSEAARFGDVVLLALPYAAIRDVLGRVDVRGKALIDCTNAMNAGRVTHERVAEEVASLTGARVVKAFSVCAAQVYAMTPPVFDGVPLAVPLCGDDQEAMAVARTLVRDIGANPVDAGPLERGGVVEAMTALIVQLWFGGIDAQRMIPPLKHAFGD